MPGIFISYRREDTAGHAGRLFDRLSARFGDDQVFMDVAGIEAGIDFVQSIERAVGSCDVLLALIGRSWLSCIDRKSGRRRLDDPNDFIRLETVTALRRDVRVIPVLVEDAEMPPPEDLPEHLQPLTRRQAVELRDSRWNADVDDLIVRLEKILAPAVPSVDDAALGAKPAIPPVSTLDRAREATTGTSQRREYAPWRRSVFRWTTLAIVLVLAVGVALYFSNGNGPEKSNGKLGASLPIDQTGKVTNDAGRTVHVYPQIVSESNRPVAQRLQAALDTQHFLVEKIDLEPQGRVGNDIVRYPSPQDEKAARKISEIVKGILAETGYNRPIEPKLIRGGTPGNIEVWIPPLSP